MKKKAIAMLMATTLVFTSVMSFTGCGGDKKPKEPDTKVETPTKFTGTRILKDTNGKVKTLNPHTYQTANESGMMGYIFEGFTTLVLNEKCDGFKFQPTLAKEMPKISADGKVYTYTLRDNLKFHDGTVIDADTFIYSYKMLLDPKLKNYRANTLFSGVYVKNAKNYFDGKCKWEEVGIKALDKKTIEFTLDIATPELNTLTGLSYFALVHPGLYEKGMNADRTETNYGTSMETTASYGAYTLKDWVFDQSFRVEKNKGLVLSDIYTPDVIECRVVEEASTILQLFENNEVDVAPIQLANFQKYSEDPRAVMLNTGGILQLNVNSKSTTNPVLKDVNFRKALYYGADRQKLAKDIAKTDLPAPYLLSPYFATMINGKAVPYRDTEPAKAIMPKDNGYDTKAAKEFFEKAYVSNGNKKITLTITYNQAREDVKAVAECLKNDYEKLFGTDKVELKLQGVPIQVRSEAFKKGNYDLGLMSWIGGDAFNPVDKFYVYTAEYGDKNDAFTNKEFDELYTRCSEGDLLNKDKEKNEAIAKMEKMMLDDLSVIPLTEGRDMVAYSDKLKLKAKNWITYLNYAAMEAEFTR